MKGFFGNIEQITRENEDFRKVLYTAMHSQLVVMSLKPGEEIGAEVHQLDQFLRFESGHGRAIVDETEYEVADGSAIVVPAGARHNVMNTSDSESLKLYTIYSPPNHRDGVMHVTKKDAEADQEHFDGHTSE